MTARFIATAALASAVAAVAWMGAARALELTPAIKQLAADADKEGEILLTWSSGTMGGPQGAKIFEDRINKIFGTKLKIKWSPGPSMPNVGQDIAMKASNGLPSPTDVYMGFSRNYAQLLKQDLFLSAPWKSYIPDRLNDRVVEMDRYVRVVSTTNGYSYNAKLAPSKPEKIEDFLKPEWKGKIATTAFGQAFEMLAAKESWGPAKTLDFAKKFSGQVAGFMRCNEVERLTSGEFLALAFDCSGDSTNEAISKGAPLARVISHQMAIVSYFYFAVPKNAVHPNAGKLFTAFAASLEGQNTIREVNDGDLHVFPESKLGKAIVEVEKKHKVKFVDAGIDWQVKNDDGNAAQQEIVKILRRK